MMREWELVERGLAGLGPAGGFVLVTTTATANLRWARSTLTTNGLTRGRHVSVVAFRQFGPGLGAAGVESGVVSDMGSLDDLVSGAVRAAELADPAEDYCDPYSPPAGTFMAAEESSGWTDPASEVAADDLAPASLMLADTLGSDSGVEHFGYAEQAQITHHLGTSSGVRARICVPQARFELCGKSANRTRSAWAGRAGTSLADLDLHPTAEEVRWGLGHQARIHDIAAGRRTAILSPSAAADLLIYLLWSGSARDALDGRNVFRGRNGRQTAIGQRLSPLPITLASDPNEPGMPAPHLVLATDSGPLSSVFDAGMPIAATEWISGGVLRALATTRHSARRGALPDSPIAENLSACVTGRSGSLVDLAARVGEGLLITCLWYIREVDAPTLLLTGLTRDGVYVVRGGEIVGAAPNFRFNDSPVGMLARLVDAGSPERCLPREWADYFTMTKVAPLAVSEFNFSSASEAV